MITFRTAKEEDVDSLATLCSFWFRDQSFLSTHAEISNEVLRMIKDGVMIIAEESGVPIGLMSGMKVYHFWIDQYIAHEHGFYVLPKYRKLGISDKLEEGFCQWGSAMGCKSVILTPTCFGSNNPKFIADALEKRGYKVHGYQMRKEL